MLNFQLPDTLQTALPTEVRNINRDEVKLMVSNRKNDDIQHTQFKHIADYLDTGDVLVVNTSGTIKAALNIILPNGQKGSIHLSNQLTDQQWLVEIRQNRGRQTKRFYDMEKDSIIPLTNDGIMHIIAPFYPPSIAAKHLQLWIVRFELPLPIFDYLNQYGLPIRYTHTPKHYPIDYYQTIFANEWGSAEMPSAGRAFTPEIITKLVIKGVQFAPILLHTGVASLELNEKPYPEFYKVSPTTASIINWAKQKGRRIIAVGTTAVRAIETVTNKAGKVQAGMDWTNLYITPERGLHTINGLLTGFHEPNASHLLMLSALAQATHLQKCYDTAIAQQYQWHEFGDLHLIL